MRPTPTTTPPASGAAALACVRPGDAGRPSVARQPTARRRGVWMPEPSMLAPGTGIAGPPRPRIRRRSRQQGRAQRWDTQPVLTARDATALRFIGEQYAVRDDVLAVLLGRLSPTTTQASGMLGPRTLRQRLGRWQQAGWVERRRMLGHTWVLPSRIGLRLAGLDFGVWEPAESRLVHHHAAAAGPPGTWPTVRCPPPCQPAGKGSTRRGSWSRSS